jgi:hypothetical protein
MFPKYSHWKAEYTSKGLMKSRLRQSVKYLALVLAVFGMYRIRLQGKTLKSLGPMLKDSTKSVLATVQGLVVRSLEFAQQHL